MPELHQQFEAAAAAAKQLRKRPDNESMLLLYALYKQATSGDVSGKRPGFTDPVGRAKYDAWAKRQGLSQAEAMQGYIDLVARLERA
jgi:acyl-CoA-binding protein